MNTLVSILEFVKTAAYFVAVGVVLIGMYQCTAAENEARDKHKARIQQIKAECDLVREEIIDMSHRQKMYRCEDGAEYVIPEYGYEK